MSQFLGNALPVQIIAQNVDMLQVTMLQAEALEAPRVPHDADYSSPWWPGAGFCGEQGLDVALMDSHYYEWPEKTSGTASRVGYQGVTRDVNNSPLGGVTVKLFRTATDEKVTPDIVSDVNTGEFIISTPYYEPHYLVMRKTGSPDVGGVSVSTTYPNT